jgi:stage III sporulation protein AD|nr:stage III sporulation protein AD [Bacilli bacterium]
MTIVPIVLFAIVGAFLVMILREISPQTAFFLTLVIAMILFYQAITLVARIIVPLEQLALLANVNVLFFATILKIIGIAYISEFGMQIAKDAGATSIAGKIELIGKLLILVLSIPIVLAVVQAIQKLLPT